MKPLPGTWREGLSPREAMGLQAELAGRVRRAPLPRRIETVAGVDVSVRGGRARAAVVALSFPALEIVEQHAAEVPLSFPYVPGLLAFREMPAILAAFAGIERAPDVLLVDGHGLAHPRRFGIACHVGVAFDLPAIGIGKTRFVGEHTEPAARRGSRRRLVHEGEVIGYALRTRDGVRPVYVSVGHRAREEDALRLVLRCAPRFRLPEPIRAADRLAGEWSASPERHREGATR